MAERCQPSTQAQPHAQAQAPRRRSRRRDTVDGPTIRAVATPSTTRSAAYAAAFVAAQEEFIRLVESLSAEQWRRVGANFPARLNDEDEQRSVGVIAHHVALNTPWIMERIERMLEGRPLAQVDIRASNAQHATEQADVSKEEVLRLLREQTAPIAAAVLAIPDDQLDEPRDTPVGPMSAAQRLERVLVGHITMHRGSILAAIA